MPEISGLELLRDLKAGNPQRPVLLITARGSIDMAVEAIKQGARDFLTKPVTDFTKLKALLDDAEREIELRRKTRRLATNVETEGLFGDFVGASKPMREVFNLIEMVAGRDVSVIMTGESGTGKELVARAIHRLSARADKPFVAVNAAAIPDTLIESEVFGHERGAFTGAVGTRPGCFEQAHGGTLFLDEIAEMPMPLQPKLLRVLADGKVRRLGGNHEFEFDVRVVVATNRNPLQAVKEGKLREDLFYRLNVFAIALPPLRERPDDVPLLAQRFIKEFNAKHRTSIEGISDEAAEELKKYPWPGNVRELRNIIERAVVLTKSDWIENAVLPPYIRSSAPSESKARSRSRHNDDGGCRTRAHHSDAGTNGKQQGRGRPATRRGREDHLQQTQGVQHRNMSVSRRVVLSVGLLMLLALGVLGYQLYTVTGCRKSTTNSPTSVSSPRRSLLQMEQDADELEDFFTPLRQSAPEE